MESELKMPSFLDLFPTSNTAKMYWIISFEAMHLFSMQSPVCGQSKSQSKTLQQYRVRHATGLQNADIALVYNSSSNYTAAGE